MANQSKGGLPVVAATAAGPTDTPRPTLLELFLEFLLIGAVSFGGGIIAYERVLLIEKRKWLTNDTFMATLAISQTMPGLNSVNIAVLAGDHLRGTLGALAATIGLILPGSAFVLGVGLLYSEGANHPLVNTLLAGIAACATGLLAAITYKIGETVPAGLPREEAEERVWRAINALNPPEALLAGRPPSP